MFLGAESSHAGRFDEQLLEELEQATFFIIILSANSLVRCANEDDWVLREVTHALAAKKTIIPVFKPDFRPDAKEGIPDLEVIHKLLSFQGISYTHGDFEGFLTKLMNLLKR